MSECTLMNMCMICDHATGRVLVQKKVGSKWAGITFPGGHVDYGESIYESTIREIKEETGLTVSKLEQVGLIHMYNPTDQTIRLIFLYKTACFEGEIIDETNEGKVYWVKLQELPDMQLAPNMREYLNVFMNDNLIEAYVTPVAYGQRAFRFLP